MSRSFSHRNLELNEREEMVQIFFLMSLKPLYSRRDSELLCGSKHGTSLQRGKTGLEVTLVEMIYCKILQNVGVQRNKSHIFTSSNTCDQEKNPRPIR